MRYDQRTHIVETEPFKDTFGPKAQRKRPRLDVGDFEELSKVGAASQEAEGMAEDETSTPGEYITRICNTACR